MTSSNPPFAPVHVIVTKVDPETAKSSLWLDLVRNPYPVERARVYNLWDSNQFPADNNDEEVGVPHTIKDHAADTQEMFNRNGSAVRLIDIPPGMKDFMHQTESLDYAVVLKGHVTLILDDGTSSEIPEGSLIVQRGTNHAWVNRSDSWVRLLFVIVPAKRVQLHNGVLHQDVEHVMAVRRASEGSI
ncbi:hypothetical protein NM208_g12093 [Fusarium decemcellulare]|uniref:Uncharacterized protein n=1 Tax=Fusarium decemcellulare TaxID=57161 RepID=A0ACC1RQ10_9HYPO|nr:hypothetical protein NM208_g12093 [Fusarium decemcellulare]